MTRARPALILLVVSTAALGACRSDSDDSSPVTDAPPTPSAATTVAAPPPGSSVVSTPTSGTASSTTSADGDEGNGGSDDDGSGGSDVPISEPPPGSTQPSAPTLVVTLPPDADELVLSDGFSGDEDGDGDGWSAAAWEVDMPGEAVVTAVDGIGVMTTDARGTHEWVRAIASESTHDDARLDARITPIRSNEGTVFVGMRGDGEWRDNASYLPQSGVVLEYQYSEIFAGEVVLILFDGPDEQRIGPVSGPILADGESANIRFEVVGREARVKVWRTGTDEPPDWNIIAPTPTGDGGLVQIAYRDGVDQSVAWDELTLRLWP